ncbi:MAG: sodium-translocating pyrophosphatase [candidate division NC10 bacterium]|nr:sodium-translocating pyrophosphatase [candidate division NC10 bacterium]
MGMVAVVAGVVGLLYARYLSAYVMRQPEGTPLMVEISSAIRQGARAFLRREFWSLTLFAIVMFFILWWMISLGGGLAYVFGTFTSALAAHLGMSIATRANARTAHAAISSYATALKTAYSSGGVMGFYVVGLGLLGLGLVYLFSGNEKVWLSYAFGASSVALFLRVGGGIFTKSADVGADLVGKVEAGIPEDDPRNPATIADNVGDNVGDIAGMGSDLFESYVSAIAASMVLGGAAFGIQGVLLPMYLAAVGIVSSIIGTLFVRPPEVTGSFEAQASQARRSMNTGLYVSNILAVVGALVLVWLYLGDLRIFWALILGLACGTGIGIGTEYFTTAEKAPVIGIARASESGPATLLIEGLAVGMMSNIPPVLLVAVATVGSFQFGGLYGIAIAAMGMLITLGTVLAIDCYGPIVDNAAGIAEMAGLGQEVRERCEALDSVGNTTAAVGKGFAIGSAALASLAWLATYFKVAHVESVSLTDVDVMAGLFIGSLLPFVFSALAMRGVGAGAFEMVAEVRRQFKEIPGLMEGTAKPDYVSCVDIATRRALRSMLLPGMIVIVAPVALGLFLGVESLAGLLMGALLTGFCMAVFMSNAGGAWDNAKKYIEAGHLGGKGSDAHKAAVIGDTVGDPFKDTAGPSLNILIKLVGKVAVIFAPLFV